MLLGSTALVASIAATANDKHRDTGNNQEHTNTGHGRLVNGGPDADDGDGRAGKDQTNANRHPWVFVIEPQSFGLVAHGLFLAELAMDWPGLRG